MLHRTITLSVLLGVLLLSLFLSHAWTPPAAEAFGEVEYNGVKYFCVVGEPWTVINICVYIETDYTNSPSGLDLSNQGDVFPFPFGTGPDLIHSFLANPSSQDTTIGWSLPNLNPLVPGSAGVLNGNAQVQCAMGNIVHLAITWDGDIHADLGPITNPSISPLVNAGNTSSGLISQPALVVEIPVWDRALFPNLSALRGGQLVRICGRWVVDTNSDEQWAELHPATSVTILEPPTIDMHANVGPIEATSPAGAVVTYSPPATHDVVDGSGTASCMPASGTTFPRGTTTVTCTATDSAGNTATPTTFTVTVVDTTPPSVRCGTSDGAWHGADVAISCTAADSGSGLANPADASFTLQTSVAAGTEDPNASTGSRRVCDIAGNCTTAGPVSGNKVDKKPPTVTCAAADGTWHATDVTIGCTAADGGSGLATAADASFSLQTSVPMGTETASAATETHQVCDAAGNCATAGPVSGNKVDKKPPAISITAPSATTYLLNQAVTASYSCTDGGSGVGSCTGPVATGSALSTSTPGSQTFAVNAADTVANKASQSVAYSVAFKVCALYDQTKAVQSGSTLPVKLFLCDASNTDVSAASLVVHATSVTQSSTNASGTLADAGNANPDTDFRYDSTLGPSGGYIYNLSTKGLATGTYNLSFTASGDPMTHSVQFQVK